jgi:hypothetical protein
MTNASLIESCYKCFPFLSEINKEGKSEEDLLREIGIRLITGGYKGTCLVFFNLICRAIEEHMVKKGHTYMEGFSKIEPSKELCDDLIKFNTIQMIAAVKKICMQNTQ